jgi:mannan endo-1,4-beta-mannosidase
MPGHKGNRDCTVTTWRGHAARGVFLFAMCVVAVAACRIAKSDEEPVATPHQQIMLGLYQITWGANQQQTALDNIAESLSGPPALVMFYRDLRRSFPESHCRRIAEFGAVPVISWELWNWGERTDGPERLPMINRGEYDEYFRNWARELRAYNDPVFIRFGFEMNGDWFSWGGRDPDGFVAAWRRVHAIFAQENATNAIWVWSPNIKSIPEVEIASWNNMHNYYPGNDVVDWVALDGYNWGKTRNSNEYRWLSFDELFGDLLAEFGRLYPDKWQMVGEFASVGSEDGTAGHGGSKAAWIAQAYGQIPLHRRLGAVVWFNLDKQREGEFDWSLTSNNATAGAYNESVKRPWYTSSYTEWITRHSELDLVLRADEPLWQPDTLSRKSR